MPEILSQNQIDELLNRLTGDAEPDESVTLPSDDPKAKLYNFKNPKKLTKDQQKVLRGIGEIFARHLASYLAGLTRSYCEVNVASLEEQPYMEYNNALPDNLITGVLDMNIIKGAMLMDLSNPVTFALIERMFGGVIEARELPSREFTDIETALMDRTVKRITSLFQEAWTYVPGISISLRQVETNTRFIKAIAMDEVVVVLVLTVKLNSVEGTITCCIPCIDIGKTLDETLAIQTGANNRPDDGDENVVTNQKAMLAQLHGSSIDLSAVLGTTTITMQEMLSLQPGDVIRLDQQVGTPIVIAVNGKKWFYGEPGIKKNKLAVLINRQYAG
jgi:flagellar motor switch protein FliM